MYKFAHFLLHFLNWFTVALGQWAMPGVRSEVQAMLNAEGSIPSAVLDVWILQAHRFGLKRAVELLLHRTSYPGLLNEVT